MSLTRLHALGTLFLLLGCLIKNRLICQLFALSYCILFCPVWLSSLEDLFFSQVEIEGEWTWGKGEVVGSYKEWIEGKP